MTKKGGAVSVRIAISAFMAISLFVSSTSYAQVPFTGELLVSGNDVRVNGEAAVNGRTIVLPSSIVTGTGSYATLNFANVGRLQLSPGSTFSIDGTGSFLRGSLSGGSVTVINAVNPVVIATTCGKVVTGRTGDIISFESVCGTAGAPQTIPKPSSTGFPAIGWAVLVGGGILAAVLAAGGGGKSSSPTT